MPRLVIGVTGTFGSGKSTVSLLMKKFGAKMAVSSDALVREAYRSAAVIKKIKKLFGFQTKLDPKEIAKEIFLDSGKRKALESLIHPFVRKRIGEELKDVRDGIVVLEVPLLFETGFDQLCDRTVVVTAPSAHRMSRLVKKGFTESEIKAREAAQFSEVEKRRRADFCISNSGAVKELEGKVEHLMNKIRLEQKSLKKGRGKKS